jgi:hypothetical protein
MTAMARRDVAEIVLKGRLAIYPLRWGALDYMELRKPWDWSRVRDGHDSGSDRGESVGEMK